MLALVVRCGEQTLRFPLPTSPVRLGSDPASDLVVPFGGVSSRHALVEPSEGGIRVVDAGSKNGLLFASRNVPECRLSPGDVVRLGRAWLSLEECDVADVEVAFAFEPCPEAARPRRNRRETETGSGGSQAGVSQRAAFRLVREADRLGPRPAPDGPAVRALLESAREALGATALVLFRGVGRAEPVPLATAGDPPGPDTLARLIRTSTAAPAVGPDGPARARQNPANGLGLVVAFGNAPAPPTWWGEVFDFLACRLLDLPAVGPPLLATAPAEPELNFPPGMVPGTSSAMRGLLAQVAATVKSRMDVLLIGETGTGKELFARLIHASGPTAKGPFIAINFAAIPAELLESELFGVHGRVATGVDPRIGRLQQAEGGTVFLDEIGELAASLQAKLLRFLQEREIHPVGATAPRSVNVRVVSASNRDLPALVRKGCFRADLFFRLSGLQFHIPPLRERREDIPALVAAVVRKASAEEGKLVRGVNRRALDLLSRHDWPGNARELENEVRRAVLLCPDGGLLQAEHFGRVRWEVEKSEADGAAPAPPGAEAAPATLRVRVNDLERRLVEEALQASGGNKTRAAEALGITRPGLIQMLRRLGRGD